MIIVIDYDAGNTANVLRALEKIGVTAELSADKEKILAAITSDEEVLVLCDLLGGTPFKVASTIMGNRPDLKMNVLSGLNLAMLLETVFARMTLSFDEVAEKAVAAAHSGSWGCCW